MILQLVGLVLAAPSVSPPFDCPQPSIYDGDYVRCAGGPKLRLGRIDAPDFENSPRCHPRRPGAVCDDALATRSRDHLRALVRDKVVNCQVIDASPAQAGFQQTDRYGRPVVLCTAGGRDLSAAQLDGGFATHWPPR